MPPMVQVWLSPHTRVMPGKAMPSSGRDDMHDALAGIADIEHADIGTLRFIPESMDEFGAARKFGGIAAAGIGIDDMIHRAEYQMRVEYRPPGRGYTLQHAAARTLMQEDTIHVEQPHFIGKRADDMLAPDFFDNGGRAGCVRLTRR